MSSQGLKHAIAVLVAGSLMGGSTAAVGSTVTTVQQPSPWAVLTAMSGGAPAAAMCSAAAATAATQGTGGYVLPVIDAPVVAPAPQPIPAMVAAPVEPAGLNPLFLGLIAIVAGAGIFLAVHNSGHANSPA